MQHLFYLLFISGVLSGFLVCDGAGGLVGGHDEDLGDLHVFRCAGGEPCDFSDVGSGQRVYAFIYIVGLGLVASETYYREVGLHEAGLDVGDSQGP